MVDRYDQYRLNEFLQGYKDVQKEAIRNNAKAGAGIVLALAGWHAYQRTKVQKGRK